MFTLVLKQIILLAVLSSFDDMIKMNENEFILTLAELYGESK